MEFKLNKIDTDVRKKMQEETKEDKVHAGNSISVKKDIKEERHDQTENFNSVKNESKYFTIDGVKYNKNINVEVEKIEEINDGNSKGRILDSTK